MTSGSMGHGAQPLVTRPGRVWLVQGIVVLLLVGLGLVLDSRTALAATQFVTSTADSGPGTLRAAIAAAGPGDTIEFSFPNGTPGCSGVACTITLTSDQLSIEKSLTISGPGATLLTVTRSSAAGTPQFRILNVAASTTVVIDGMTISNGISVCGGGIHNAGSLTLTNSAVTNNRATSEGGGICNVAGAPLTVNTSRIANNAADGSGGGIINRGPMTIANSTIADNQASLKGGGVYVGEATTITHSLISGNAANPPPILFYGGGGVYAGEKRVLIVSSTLSANTTTDAGGAVHAGGWDSEVALVNSTLVANRASPSGLGHAAAGVYGHVSFKNSIIVRAPTPLDGADCVGVVGFVGVNLSSHATCEMPVADLRLGPLADNGGFTLTHKLEAGSAAIDGGGSGGCTDGAGQPLLTDQRGVRRPANGNCDLGAYETVPEASGFTPPPVVVAIRDHVAREDIPLGPLELRLASSYKAAGSTTLTVVWASDNPDLVPNDRIIVSPPTGPGGTRLVTVTPLANQSGSARITLTVSDGGIESAVTRFTVNVLDVNDVPSFTSGPNVKVLDTAGQASLAWATAISAGPPKEQPQGLTFLVTNNSPQLFSVQPEIDSQGKLSLTPAVGAGGVATVTVQLKDSGGTTNGGVDTSAPQTFTVTVAISNKPPVAGIDSFMTNAGATLNVAAPGVLTNDTDPEGQTLTSIKVKDPTHGSLTLNADGSFKYIPTAGYVGPDSFTYKANDGSADSGTVSVSLTVVAVTPQACAPRPNPNISTQQVGPGRLQVTVTAQTNASLPGNALTRLEFGAAHNARIEVPGAAPGSDGGPSTVPGQPAGTPGGFPLTLPANTQQTTFIVQRTATGEFKADLVIVDSCQASPFRTFVGGGPSVK